MDLRGWDYTGRNISYDLHLQIFNIVNSLSDKDFVGVLSWGKELQTKLLAPVGISSTGVLRTVKKICDNFGFFNKQGFKPDTIPNKENILTPLGKKLFYVIDCEKKIKESNTLSEIEKNKAFEQIKILYEEIYCEALTQYKIENNDGSFFYPLQITVKALRKYKSLDKWEWYLLNTCIKHNNCVEEEEYFDKMLIKYRNGELNFSMNNVVGKEKGHQYLPQYFNYAGLAIVDVKPKWIIKNSLSHTDIKDKLLEKGDCHE